MGPDGLALTTAACWLSAPWVLNSRSWPKPWGGLAGLAAMSELVVGGLSWLGTHYGGLLVERTLGAQQQAWAEALGLRANG